MLRPEVGGVRLVTRELQLRASRKDRSAQRGRRLE